MTNLTVSKGYLKSEIDIPPSKSYANRALIIAALKKEPFTLHNLPESTDVTILIENLEKIGLVITTDQRSYTIENSFPECEQEGTTLRVGEGGTTARFLAALLLRGSKPYHLLLGEKLKTRPWSEFTDLVRTLGASAELVDNKLFLQGPLKIGKTLEVDCTRTTQFASGLQLAFSFSQETKIIPLNMTSSQSYWLMTEKLIKEIRDEEEFFIPLDWSSASYALAFGALNQEIFFPELHYDKFQADSKFFDLLKSLGSAVEYADGIRVKPVKVSRNVEMNVSDCLDLVPTLGYFLSHVKGLHCLAGIENLIHKESDRLGEIIRLLKVFSREAYTETGKLFIKGSTEVIDSCPDLDLPNDHRMVMAGTLFLLHHSGGSLNPSAAVTKSYPDFFKIIQ